VPKPVKTWNQIGLSSKILEQIKKMEFETPMPIQAQALPVIMSGRDCIGIAKTGSGKTLAFVLPMLSPHSRPGMLSISSHSTVHTMCSTHNVWEKKKQK